MALPPPGGEAEAGKRVKLTLPPFNPQPDSEHFRLDRDKVSEQSTDVVFLVSIISLLSSSILAS